MTSSEEALRLLEKALEPCIAGVGSLVVDDVVVSLAKATLRQVLREQVQSDGRDLLIYNRDTIIAEKICDDIIREVVGATVPALVRIWVYEEAKIYLLAKRSERFLDDLIGAEMNDVAENLILEEEASQVGQILLDETLEHLACEVAESTQDFRIEQRQKAVGKKVAESVEKRILHLSILRYLTQVLGKDALPVAVHRSLSLHATASLVGRLESVIRAATADRDRLKEEPLLKDAFKTLCRDAAFLAISSDLRTALDADDIRRQTLEDEAYFRPAAVADNTIKTSS